MTVRRLLTPAALALILALPAAAQQGGLPGGFRHDATQPIKISADALEVRQNEQTAVFSGSVDAQQGDVRMQAQRLVVTYDPEADDDTAGAIRRVQAEGDVFISGREETASGNWADYDVASGTITMGDDVVLTQGEGNVLAGTKLSIDLNSGFARMEGGVTATGQGGGSGRVQAIFDPATRDGN